MDLVIFNRYFDMLGSAAPGAASVNLDWIKDTFNGQSISSWFNKDPTIFFDPQSTATKALGTYKYPYKTQAQLENVIKGNMAGQVLGFKTGSILRTTGNNGFRLSIHGTVDKPFIICPYGSSEKLPIVTGAYIANTWISYDIALNIWSVVIGAIEHDVWRDDVRMKKKIYETSVGSTLTEVNRSTYISNTLYLRLNPGETPNDNLTEISRCDTALGLKFSNVAASGYFQMYGMEIKKARNSACGISKDATFSNITSVSDIVVAGCKFSGAGVDNTLNLGRDGLVIYGVSNLIRITNLHLIGNYSEDCLNHNIEIAGTNGAMVEHNRSFNCHGSSIIELWSSNSNALIRYNWGDYSGCVSDIINPPGQGIIFANKEIDGDTEDKSNTKNLNNKAIFNLITRPKIRGIFLLGGSGHEILHNTVYIDPDSTNPGTNLAASGWATGGNAATGFAIISNNLFYWKKGVQMNRFPSMVHMSNPALGSTNSIPSGNNNIYFVDWDKGDSNFKYSGTVQENFTTYKSNLSTYNLDQNSNCSTKNTGGTLTAVSLLFVEPTNLTTTLAASKKYDWFLPEMAFSASPTVTPGLTTLTNIGNTCMDGSNYIPNSAVSGAFYFGE